MFDVLNGAQRVAEQSRHVAIDLSRLEYCAVRIKQEMKKTGPGEKWHSHSLNPMALNEQTAHWIFLCDLLNFSFWTEEKDPFTVNYKGTSYTGYWSLPALLNRAIDEQIPILDPAWILTASDEQLLRVFRSDSRADIPLLSERIRLLRETATVLVYKWKGSFANCIEVAQHSAQKLIELVVADFHSFVDCAFYNGYVVWLLKRAQILVADLWACFNGSSYGRFTDINSVTIFADYRVPQRLQSLGLLEFSEELESDLWEKKLFSPQDDKVVEIRCCTIWAAELLRRQIDGMNAIELDFWLWDTSPHGGEEQLPFHRTRSILY